MESVMAPIPPPAKRSDFAIWNFGVAILTTRAGTLVGSVVADGFLFAPFWTAQLRTDICLVAVLLLMRNAQTRPAAARS